MKAKPLTFYTHTHETEIRFLIVVELWPQSHKVSRSIPFCSLPLCNKNNTFSLPSNSDAFLSLFFLILLCAPSVVSAKPQSPKLPNRQSRLSSFVEVTADGLSSETKKTGKRSGHLELQWNEDLTL